MDEFQRIKQVFAPLTKGYSGAFGLTDDVACLNAISKDFCHLVTMDTLVEHIHFIKNSNPKLLAMKALAVNLSDLAAKGASPECYFLSLALPDSVDDAWLMEFAKGLEAQQLRYGFHLAGGDSVATNGSLTITITIIGKAGAGETASKPDWLKREGAQLGDIIYVTGTIGDGYLGLKASKGESFGFDLDDESLNFLKNRYECPTPRLEIGQALSKLGNDKRKGAGRISALDISDGLVADCEHLLNANQIELIAVIEAKAIPLSHPASLWLAQDLELFPNLITGGDDYEILFTAPPSLAPEIEELAKHHPITKIGRLESQTIRPQASQNPKVQVITRDGTIMPLTHKGYRHQF